MRSAHSQGIERGERFGSYLGACVLSGLCLLTVDCGSSSPSQGDARDAGGDRGGSGGAHAGGSSGAHAGGSSGVEGGRRADGGDLTDANGGQPPDGSVQVDGGGKPHISTTQDNVCSQIAAVTCYDLYRCCSEGQIETYLSVSVPRTEDECVTDVTRLCQQKLATFTASVAAGRATFDAAVMNACLETLLLPGNICVSVGSVLPWAEACMKVAWVGTVPVGGTCFHSLECADTANSYCAPNQTCTALPTENMSCPVGGVGCAAGFYCNAGVCHAQIANGGTCISNLQCTKGNYCNSAQPRACAPLQKNGQLCTGNASCQSNHCLPGLCANSTALCFASADCPGRCSNNNVVCTLDSNCGPGTCSLGSTSCTSSAQCIGPGNTCVFPNSCTLTSCTGNVECADTQVNTDYCTGAVASLPISLP